MTNQKFYFVKVLLNYRVMEFGVVIKRLYFNFIWLSVVSRKKNLNYAHLRSMCILKGLEQNQNQSRAKRGKLVKKQ